MKQEQTECLEYLRLAIARGYITREEAEQAYRSQDDQGTIEPASLNILSGEQHQSIIKTLDRFQIQLKSMDMSSKNNLAKAAWAESSKPSNCLSNAMSPSKYRYSNTP